MPLDKSPKENIIDYIPISAFDVDNIAQKKVLKSNLNLTMKNWYLSKTILLAILQGVSGVMLAFLANDPALSGVGWFMTGKSFIDILLRFSTYTEVK